MNRYTITSLGEAYAQIAEALRLNPDHTVHHDGQSADFAKSYVAAHKGDYSASAPSPKHIKDQEEFHNNYDVTHVHSGFAGTGTDHFTHKSTGDKFEVARRSNGKGFYGTDHTIRKLKESATESIEETIDQLDEDTKGSADKVTHIFHIKTTHPTAPKKGVMKFSTRQDLKTAAATVKKHYEGQGHTDVSVVYNKTVAVKKPSTSTPEQRMKARERHWHKTGVSKNTTNWLKQRGML